jgi:large subunit ribosomal protein L9
MKVLLLDDVENIGSLGSVVQVASGYARNFLLPKKLAKEVTRGKVDSLLKQIAGKKAKAEKARLAVVAVKEEIEKLTLEFAKKAGETGKLFGSVTHSDVADALKAQGFEVDKKKIHELTALNTLGEHSVEIKLHPEVTATVSVNIAAE